MTDRLYYYNSAVLNFNAQALSVSPDGLRVLLDRTAFYPTSGGQPNDLGTLAGQNVVDVIDEDDHIAHLLASPAAFAHGATISGEVDPRRRLDHMQQHTGQHLLSAVLAEEFERHTVSFHLGATVSTIDIEPSEVPPNFLIEAEARVNERLRENLPVSISFEDSPQGLRKPSERSGVLRVISIEGLDRSACGGTHVSRTGEIGYILLGKTEKIRKSLRLEFFCGGRVQAEIQRRLAELAPLRDRLAFAEKSSKKLALEIATLAGQHKYLSGVRHWREEVGEITEDHRTTVNSFTENEATSVILTALKTGAILYAAHPSLGIDCGKRLKPLLEAHQGRGGGSAKQAQGSIPDAAQLEALAASLDNPSL